MFSPIVIKSLAALVAAASLASGPAPQLSPAVTEPSAAAVSMSDPAPAVPATTVSNEDVVIDSANKVAKITKANDVSGFKASDRALEGQVVSGGYVSEPVTGVATFQVFGVTWDADAAVEPTAVEYRVLEDGVWSGWQSTTLIDPDAEVVTTKHGTAPVASDGATGYQVRLKGVDAAPKGLSVAAIATGTGTADAQLPALANQTAEELADTPVGVRSAAFTDLSGQRAEPSAEQTGTLSSSRAATKLMPTIITREAWGAVTGATPRQVAAVKHAVIHHTASSNDYDASTEVAQVRGIDYYHTVTLGWGYPGYHFIVGKSGAIYEGVPGSIESKSQGAHSRGFNGSSTSVSAMGNYEEVAPTAAMMESITKVLAWDMARYDLDPMASVKVTSGGNTKYAAGTEVTVPVIGGHYVTSWTACPGKYIIPKIDGIRADVAKRLAAAESSSATVPAPAPSTPKPSASGTYTVVSGDGWYRIASKTGVSVATLLKLNNATLSTPLYVGDVIKTGAITTAPAPAPSTSKPSTSGTYTVVSGDGWYRIASKTGVPVNTLLKLNNATLSTPLYVGDVIKTAASKTATVVNTPSVNVRSGPDTSYSKVGVVYSGQRFTVLGTSGSWTKVSFNGGAGWIHSYYLQTS